MNNNNTIVYVKVAGPRPDDFVEPPPFDWSQEKERQLWQFISKLDKQEDHINWEQLSETFDTPIYFLKKRCYKMFSMRLELLKQKIQHKKKILESDTRAIETEKETKPEQDITYPFVEDKDKINNEHTTNDISDRLHNIKLSNYKPPVPTKDAPATTSSANRSVSDNETDDDISSSLSVSKSALEEALMARLNF